MEELSLELGVSIWCQGKAQVQESPPPQPWFKSQVCSFPAARSWANPITSASLGFLICQMGIQREPASRCGRADGLTRCSLQTKIWTDVSGWVGFHCFYRALEGNKGLGIGMHEAADPQEERGGRESKGRAVNGAGRRPGHPRGLAPGLGLVWRV